MPTILRKKGFRFYFYAEEGVEPPHIHADKEGGTLKVWLKSLEVAYSKGLKNTEISIGLDIIKEHREEFLKAWDEFNRRKS